MRFYLIIILLIFLTNCKITEQTLVGSFAYEHQQKTKLILNADKTFKFIKINRSPYLFILDHPDERFYITQGHWQFSNKKLFLTSYTDSLTYNLADVKLDSNKNLKYSTFNFYDVYSDSIGIGSVELSDGTTVIPGPKRMFYGFDEDLAKIRSLKFNFFGYAPWNYIATDSINHNFNIYFTPVFRPNYFNQTLFKLKNKMIIQKKQGDTYRFKKEVSG